MKTIERLATDWMPDAACLGNPLPFHSDDPSWTSAAKQMCKGCPVRRDCLAYALALDDPYGVWGGLTAAERRDLRARQRGARRV